MKRLTNRWGSDGQARMVKMFAESVLELTNQFSMASYRHRTLSSTAKAGELRFYIGEVGKRHLPKPSLDPMIEEYDDAVETDPILNHILSDKGIPLRAIKVDKKSSLEQMRASLRIFFEVAAPVYARTAEDLIRALCERGKPDKSLLRRYADLYISQLVSARLSREYIHICAKQEFAIISVEGNELGALCAFLRRMATREDGFEILLNMQKAACQFIEGTIPAKIYNAPGDLPDRFRLSISSVKDIDQAGPFVIVTPIPGGDPYSAARSFKYFLDMLQSFLFVFPDGKKWTTPTVSCVYDPLTGGVFRVPLFEFVNEGNLIRDAKFHRELISRMTKFTFDRLGSRGQNSSRKVVGALQAASAASRISENDARLLSIWSAFEALLPVPMKDGESIVRITHFVNYIAPLAAAQYMRNLFKGLHDDLVKNYKGVMNSFLDKNGTGANRFQKFVSLFFSDDATKLAFTALFQDSELLLSRAHELDKIANDPGQLLRRIEAHEERVSWQLHRIYRARNMIVHTARNAQFTPHLIENAFSYFRALVGALVEVADRVQVSDSDALFDLCLAMSVEHKEHLKLARDGVPSEFLRVALRGAFSR